MKLRDPGIQVGAINVRDDFEMADFLENHLRDIDKKRKSHKSRIMTIFQLMINDPQYTGIGGYLNNGNRTKKTDKQLLAAADTLRLNYHDLFLWVNSRYARHFMDQVSSATPQRKFEIELATSIPDLKEEVFVLECR